MIPCPCPGYLRHKAARYHPCPSCSWAGPQVAHRRHDLQALTQIFFDGLAFAEIRLLTSSVFAFAIETSSLFEGGGPLSRPPGFTLGSI